MQISNVNFICNFLCIFQCNLLCTPACKTNIQGPPMQRRGKSFASSRPARCIGGVLRNTAQCCPEMPSAPTAPTAVLPPLAADLLHLPSSRTLLFSSKPPLPSAARRCPVLPQLPQQCSPSSHSSQAARSGHSFRTAAANRPHQQQQVI